MAIFAMSDLHLPLSVEKPMDVFGGNWQNYVEKIEQRWRETVTDSDAVIVCGDLSWATYLEESAADFAFIHALPGVKLISKGNHDYWWTTRRKMEAFMTENGFSSIKILHNSCAVHEGVALCATRGWITPKNRDFRADDEKIYQRELGRLECSLKEAVRAADTVIAALHYPPEEGFLELLREYGVSQTVFGHLHGRAAADYVCRDATQHLVSSDFLDFRPLRLF